MWRSEYNSVKMFLIYILGSRAQTQLVKLMQKDTTYQAILLILANLSAKLGVFKHIHK